MGLGILAIPSCTTEDIDSYPQLSSDPIQFCTTGLSVQSRSIKQQLSNGDQFGVLGYCAPLTAPNSTTLNYGAANQPWDTKKSLCTPYLFYKQKVSCSDNGNTTYDPIKPWYSSADYTYAFFAYYPYNNCFAVSGESELGAPTFTFTMPTGSEGKHDAMIAFDTQVTRGDGVVDLSFVHLLTGLNVQINNYNSPDGETPGDNLVVHSLALEGTFNKKITIDFDTEARTYPNETYNKEFMLIGSDKTIEGLTSCNLLDDDVDPILLITNNGDLGENIKIRIGYTFGNTNCEDNPKEFLLPDSFHPMPGTIYTVHLNFIGGAFVLQFVAESTWEDGCNSDITFQ